MRTRPKCPNCGQEAFGTMCRWCHQPLTINQPFEKSEQREVKKSGAPRPQFPVVDRLLQRNTETTATVKNEERAVSSTMVFNDARQKASQIIARAEQVARDIAGKGQNEAEAKSARLLAEATEKAEQIIHNAERQSAQILDKIKTEAEAKSTAIISDARQKSDQIISIAELTARELMAQESIVIKAQAEAET